MDSSSFFYLSLTLTLTSLFLFIKLFFTSSSKDPNRPPLPPSPRGLPIIGHLHLLQKPLCHALARLAQKHGPIFFMRFGNHPILAINNQELAVECFTKNDIAFANRPQLPLLKTLTYNFTTLSSSNYGPQWRNVRRIATVEFLCPNRVQQLKDIRADEARFIVTNLFKKNPIGQEYRKVILKPMLFAFVLNVLVRMITGKKLYTEDPEASEDLKKFKEMVVEDHVLNGASNYADFLPILRWIDFQGVRKRLDKVEAKREIILQGLVDDEKRKGEYKRIDNERKSMLQVMLSLQEEDPKYYTDELIKATVMTLLFAGTDTSCDTLEWCLTMLLNNPDVHQKLRDILDAQIPKNRLIQDSDLADLPYLHSVVHETLRFYPPAPLLIPHESLEECTVGGYYIPRGTMLLVNTWAIHRDPNVWPDPHEFRPERFLEMGPKTGKLFSFGMGRRGCAGVDLGTRMVMLTLGSLVQCFDWKRVGSELVDTTQAGGLTLPKVHNLECLYKTREYKIELLNQLVK